ncbi:MAG: phosphatase PAP2 family protein [Bacilli bacterium]|jgi:undecaprenyl-diphosphatase|nr:phosphatase PAP2 family protein [Bacilli bacterium]
MKKRIIAGSLIVIGIIFGVIAKLNLTSDLDTFIYNIIIKMQSDSVTQIFKAITFLASTKFILCLNIIALIIYIIKKRGYLLLIPVNSIFSVVSNNLIKFLIKRPRPNVLRLVTETNYSYPSGHAMISVLFYGTIITLLNRNNIKYRKIINIILMLIILLVGVSRIYLGVHYASDIIGGYLISTGILLFTKKENNNESINNRSK